MNITLTASGRKRYPTGMPVTFRVSAEQHEALRQLAAQQDRSMAYLLKQAVNLYLQQVQEEKGR